jgi:hypothetical protein
MLSSYGFTVSTEIEVVVQRLGKALNLTGVIRHHYYNSHNQKLKRRATLQSSMKTGFSISRRFSSKLFFILIFLSV